MKDSQPGFSDPANLSKYIKADNERFSTLVVNTHASP